MRHGAIAILLGAVHFAAPLAARADAPSERERAAARALGDEGNVLWDQGDIDGALDRFSRALDLVHAPTLALRQAECLEKLGRWVEASEKMIAIGRIRLDDAAPEVFREAAQDAWRRGHALRDRIPKLIVTVEGPDNQEAVLSLDGRPVEHALWGVGQPVDPGTRFIVLQRGAQRVEQTIVLREGEEKHVVIRLVEAGEENRPAQVREPDGGTSSWAWVAVGVGAAGLTTGAVMWGLARGKESDLRDAGCADGRCPLSAESDLDSYDTLRTGAFLGLGIGLVGVAGGTLLLLLDNEQPAEQRSHVQPWLGWGAAGMRGRF